MTDNATSTSGGYVGGGVWIALYSIIICAAVAGNVLTLLAIIASRQLSSLIANQYIFSLAISDLMVGITIPYHMCFYLVESFGTEKDRCLLRFVLISFGCTSSIMNLFVVAIDRYSAIVHPLMYNRYMTRGRSLILISISWLNSLTLSTVIIYWNSWDGLCDVNIIPYIYFQCVWTPLFALVWGVMLLIYIKIWREASSHAKRMKCCINPQNISDTKSIQVVMLTLGCFSICWMPYFIVTSYFRITDTSIKFSLSYEIAFTLAVCNSGMNPMIYAWKNSNFREAFWCLLTFHSPNKVTKKTNYITNHEPSSKKSSTANGMDRGHDNVVAQSDIDVEMSARTQRDYDEHECSVSTETTTVNTLT